MERRCRYQDFSPTGRPTLLDGLQPVNLQPGYSFPFDGTTYNSITVATSGFIWLAGTNGAQCCDLGDETNTLDLFENGPPRIAPGWADLLPNEGGSIDVNQITDGFGSRTDITYFQVATESNDVSPVTVQVQLFNSGVIGYSLDETFDSTSLGPNPAALIGLAALLGTPQSVDLTNLPISTSANQIYDYLTTVGGFNLGRPVDCLHSHGKWWLGDRKRSSDSRTGNVDPGWRDSFSHRRDPHQTKKRNTKYEAMNMCSRASGVVVVAPLLLLTAAAVMPAFAQGVKITNSPTPGTVGLTYSFQFAASGATSYVYTCQCVNPCSRPDPIQHRTT